MSSVPVDAIVVLGCKSQSRLRRRVAAAAKLFWRGAAPAMVLSGGGAGPEPEAERMRRAALALGVPAEMLVLEPNSNDTLGNARLCAALLSLRGWDRVVLVSDRAHLPRAALMFRIAGLSVVNGFGVGAPSLRAAVISVLYEAAAWPVSLLRALLTARESRHRPRACGR
jgi:uncharacterized SAM-binding protein YcdF (DUF218 family)